LEFLKELEADLKELEWSGRLGCSAMAYVICPWCHVLCGDNHKSDCLINKLKLKIQKEIAENING
jgi:hypothetical protein